MNSSENNQVSAGEPDWSKSADGLLPAIVQDDRTGRVLMLAWMNRESYYRTKATGKVTFFSRSRNALWVKGETSGNWLNLVSVDVDCDADTLLIVARPDGPACHRGTTTCFSENASPRGLFLSRLQQIVESRRNTDPAKSYSARLLAEGINRIAQKVGEEGVETALAAVTRNDEGLIDECSDLLYHLVVLMTARGLKFEDVIMRLADRHSAPA
jgi:phosphoribosyl-AMP cyclohydrolase / phosphoribosyl-ATP pyrophosphohydrolase